eukprot:scaffold293_cov267-Prasinococcus_capsulatus_cf.AAC.5
MLYCSLKNGKGPVSNGVDARAPVSTICNHGPVVTRVRQGVLIPQVPKQVVQPDPITPRMQRGVSEAHHRRPCAIVAAPNA